MWSDLWSRNCFALLRNEKLLALYETLLTHIKLLFMYYFNIHAIDLHQYFCILICKANRGQELPVQTEFSSVFWIHLRTHNNDSNAKCAYNYTNCPVQENLFKRSGQERHKACRGKGLSTICL